MKNAVLFDMDGTLLNSLPDLATSVNYALGQMGYPQHSEEVIATFVGNGVRRLMARAIPEGVSTEDADRTFYHFRDYYKTHSYVKTLPYAGVFELIEQLQKNGIGVGIVSNKSHDACVLLADKFFNIPVVIGEQETYARKPAGDMLIAAMDKLGTTPEQTIYVGDSEVDKMSADNANCLPVVVTWGYRSRSVLEELGGEYHLADTVAELRAILELLSDKTLSS